MTQKKRVRILWLSSWAQVLCGITRRLLLDRYSIKTGEAIADATVGAAEKPRAEGESAGSVCMTYPRVWARLFFEHFPL